MLAAETEQLLTPPSPRELALDLLGLHLLGRATRADSGAEPLPAQLIADVLLDAGVSDSATRTSLTRMVNRGELVRHRSGRTSFFEPTPAILELLRHGRERMFAPTPFDHPDQLWTILNCPVPESMRNVRYNLQVRLAWAGFGAVQPNHWVAPGQVDIDDLLEDIVPEEARAHIHAFHGTPTPRERTGQLVRAAWDLVAIRAAHDAFISRWRQDLDATGSALTALVLLLRDWGNLLRIDPGLPTEHLGPAWPAPRSANLFQGLDNKLGPRAEQELHDRLQRYARTPRE